MEHFAQLRCHRHDAERARIRTRAISIHLLKVIPRLSEEPIKKLPCRREALLFLSQTSYFLTLGVGKEVTFRSPFFLSC